MANITFTANWRVKIQQSSEHTFSKKLKKLDMLKKTYFAQFELSEGISNYNLIL
jgi:hypothetical protein